MSNENEAVSYVDRLYNDDILGCLDALKEADEAVETINKDMFNQIARVCHDIISDGGNVSVVKKNLKAFEKKYKEARSVQHMPGSYRSAKSVIISAINEEIELVDDDGNVSMGKTALEKHISRSRNQRKQSESREELTAERAIDELLRKIQQVKTLRCFDSDRLSARLTECQREIHRIRDHFL